MRLLVFGSRTYAINNLRPDDPHYMERSLIVEKQHLLLIKVLWDTKYCVLIHGGAKGADQLAAWVTSVRSDMLIKIEEYKADWVAHGRAAGPFRNRKMITEGKPDKAFGFIDRRTEHDPISPGSRNMYQQLKNNNIPVELFQ